MALVVEDGTGLANANSYLSVADFKTYHTDRANSWGTATDPAISGALIRATDYIDRLYGSTFVGEREFPDDQALFWPRINGSYPDGRDIPTIPPELESATAEYAMRALDGPLAPDPTYAESNAQVKEHEERVGPIVERTLYGSNGMISIYRSYPEADALMKPLLVGGGSLYLLRM